jgi:hypothetical protein
MQTVAHVHGTKAVPSALLSVLEKLSLSIGMCNHEDPVWLIKEQADL